MAVWGRCSTNAAARRAVSPIWLGTSAKAADDDPPDADGSRVLMRRRYDVVAAARSAR